MDNSLCIYASFKRDTQNEIVIQNRQPLKPIGRLTQLTNRHRQVRSQPTHKRRLWWATVSQTTVMMSGFVQCTSHFRIATNWYTIGIICTNSIHFLIVSLFQSLIHFVPTVLLLHKQSKPTHRINSDNLITNYLNIFSSV